MAIIVPILTGVITILELSEKFSSLAIGQKTFDTSIRGKTVFSPSGIINWFYSSLAVSDSITKVGKEPLGVLTGNVYRSKINSNLYYEVALTRNIGGGFDTELIWIKFNDIEVYTKQKNDFNLISFFLLMLALFWEKK